MAAMLKAIRRKRFMENGSTKAIHRRRFIETFESDSLKMIRRKSISPYQLSTDDSQIEGKSNMQTKIEINELPRSIDVDRLDSRRESSRNVLPKELDSCRTLYEN